MRKFGEIKSLITAPLKIKVVLKIIIGVSKLKLNDYYKSVENNS